MATKRSSNGGGSSAPPSFSHYNDRGIRERWPVLVYRLQSHRGWEVYSDHADDKDVASKPVGNPNASKSSKGGSSNARGQGRPDAQEELTAAPRRGCIEVRKMRLRIKLFSQHTPWDPNEPAAAGASAVGGGDDTAKSADADAPCPSAEPGEDGWNGNSLLVRRRNALLITTRRGMGAVALQFKSTRDCLDFCDRLVFLNEDLLAAPTEPLLPSRPRHEGGCTVENGIVNGMDRRELRRAEMIDVKRRRLGMHADGGAVGTKLAPRSQQSFVQGTEEVEGIGELDEEAPAKLEEAKLYDRQDEMMSYIVRLAHSEEFRGFVDEIERGLELGMGTVPI